MKLTRLELKKIVKECLLEILTESLGNNSREESHDLASQQKISKITTQLASDESTFLENKQKLNTTVQQKVAQTPSLQLTPRRPPPYMREAVKREAGGNKVMEDILADTASSTLQKMIQSDRQVPAAAVGGGIAERIVSEVNPEDLFGDEVASKWANLAFMESPIKK